MTLAELIRVDFLFIEAANKPYGTPGIWIHLVSSLIQYSGVESTEHDSMWPKHCAYIMERVMQPYVQAALVAKPNV